MRLGPVLIYGYALLMAVAIFVSAKVAVDTYIDTHVLGIA